MNKKKQNIKKWIVCTSFTIEAKNQEEAEQIAKNVLYEFDKHEHFGLDVDDLFEEVK